MGYTTWNDNTYTTRSSVLKNSGYKTGFVYDEDIKSGKKQAKVHDDLNPNGVIRESRDSNEHPESNAIILNWDITGSFGEVPRIFQTKLSKFYGMLVRRGYLSDPQIMSVATGDARTDRAPLQVTQFESGNEFDEDLGKIWIEGNGGGQGSESYDLAMYFAARQTRIDCYEKRGKKGYMFILCDEMYLDNVYKKHLQKVLGVSVEANIPIKQIAEELKEKYEVFVLIPTKGSCYSGDMTINNKWAKLFPERVIKLENNDLVCETICSLIGVNEGIIDSSEAVNNLIEDGTSVNHAKAVGTAISNIRPASLAKTNVSGSLVNNSNIGVSFYE